MPLRNLLVFTLLCPVLMSCGSANDVRETLGLNRKAPDEFKVYSRPALTVPPEFNLRAPGTATDAPTTASAGAQARDAVLGTPRTTTGNTGNPPSGADAKFLHNAGAHRVSPNVRTQIQQDAENGVMIKDSNYLLSTTADGEPLVDASKEAERIKQNKAENKSPAEGETPVIKPKGKGIMGTLSDLF